MVLEISVFHDSSKEVLLCKICNVHQVLQNVQVNITPLASRGALVFSILDSSPASHADCNMEQAERNRLHWCRDPDRSEVWVGECNGGQLFPGLLVSLPSRLILSVAVSSRNRLHIEMAYL